MADLLSTEMIDPVTGEIIDQKEFAERLLAQAREQRVSLVGPGGWLAGLTRQVIETALDAEMTEHFGYDRNEPRAGENARNGTRAKTVITEIGPVEIEVPRDRDASFEPQIVRKRQRRLDGIGIVCSEQCGARLCVLAFAQAERVMVDGEEAGSGVGGLVAASSRGSGGVGAHGGGRCAVVAGANEFQPYGPGCLGFCRRSGGGRSSVWILVGKAGGGACECRAGRSGNSRGHAP